MLIIFFYVCINSLFKKIEEITKFTQLNYFVSCQIEITLLRNPFAIPCKGYVTFLRAVSVLSRVLAIFVARAGFALNARGPDRRRGRIDDSVIRGRAICRRSTLSNGVLHRITLYDCTLPLWCKCLLLCNVIYIIIKMVLRLLELLRRWLRPAQVLSTESLPCYMEYVGLLKVVSQKNNT